MKFGTSGLRGLSVDLAGGNSAVYALAFARYILGTGQVKPGDTVLVGRDFRPSSPRIAAIAMAALRDAGLVPVDCGTLPTPALALYGLETGAAALMVTGSHIPADRNGIKFYLPTGEIGKDDEQAISAIAADMFARGVVPEPVEFVGENRETEAMRRFSARNSALLPQAALAGLKIGVYQHSTVARDLFVEILRHYGAETVALGRSDSFIPVDTEAVSAETVALLKRWAAEHGLDAIVSADGDGDRPLVADETGEPLRGDLLGLVAARFLDADVVATPVTSNSGIDRCMGLPVTRTRVGSPYVIAAMTEAVRAGHRRVIGFEANGGLLTASDLEVNGAVIRALPTRDSVLPALAVLSLRALVGEPLSRIVGTYRLPVALSDRLENFPVETSSALMRALSRGPEAVAGFLEGIGVPAGVDTLDGLRIRLEDGRIVHFRPSGNAPEMRCYVEAGTPEEAADLLASAFARIRAWEAASLTATTETGFKSAV
ncbi:phosphomannomutase [Ensifer soli]|uniref:phosphomannomutase n=1 Tax=Ciceribacter sp. sgz301302 TaxID=3342379 RepID=UPI0035BB22DB